MPEAENYISRVEELAEVEVSVTTVEEAERVLEDLQRRKKRLRHIKKEVNHDMKRIRSEYKRKRANTGAGFAIGRKAVKRSRAKRKRRVTRKRDRKLAPYEELKHTIEDTILKMDEAKLQIEDWIREAEKEGVEVFSEEGSTREIDLTGGSDGAEWVNEIRLSTTTKVALGGALVFAFFIFAAGGAVQEAAGVLSGFAFLGCLGALVVGLVAPRFVLLGDAKPSRRTVLKWYGGGMVVGFLAMGLFLGEEEPATQNEGPAATPAVDTTQPQQNPPASPSADSARSADSVRQ